MKIRRLSSLLVFLVLSGCLSIMHEGEDPIAVLKTVVLHSTISIPGNQAKVYIQNGKVINAKHKDQYKPHCWFLSQKVLPEPQQILPTTFRILKIRFYEDMVSNQNSVLVAANNLHQGYFMDTVLSISAIESSTEFSITSDINPEIFRLTCSRWDSPEDAEHLTLNEIQTALGTVATLLAK